MEVQFRWMSLGPRTPGGEQIDADTAAGRRPCVVGGIIHVNGRHVGDRTPLGKETAAALMTQLGSWGFPAL